MNKAIAEVYESLHMQFLRACSLAEKALMVALMVDMRASNKASATVQSIHQRLETHLALLLPSVRCTDSAVVSLATGLAQRGLLVCAESWRYLRMQVQFKVEISDVATALKEDARLAPLHSLMSA